jgi:amino acid adenylation domain-containing protein
MKDLKNLSPEKLELLALRALRARKGGAGEPSKFAIPRLPRDGQGQLFLPSFGQQRLWFVGQLEPNSAAYNISDAVRLLGPLDMPALERSLNEVLRRHEVLRTAFTKIDGQPRQVIAPSLHLKLPLTDLRGLPPSGRMAEAARLAAESAMRPFDLSAAPLMRAVLYRVGDEEHVVLLTMHHVVSDVWSLSLLIREVAAHYAAAAAGRPAAALPELPIQYADYAAWQRGRLRGEVLESQLGYWRRQLDGADATLELPTDRPRSAASSPRGATYKFTLPPGLSPALKELSRGADATPFMTLLAAFNVLLFRYTGQEDILVGSPVAGRVRAELEHLIGFFVNTLLLRTDLSGDPSFSELLGRVREASLQAFANEEVPVEKVVEELRAAGRREGLLPRVTFALQNAPSEGLKLAGLRVERVPSLLPVEVGDDLYLSMYESAQGLAGSIRYRADLFDEGSIARVVGHFRTLLEAAAADPLRPVSRLPLLTDEERRQVLFGWNDTAATAAPRVACVHHLFEEQAARDPQRPAVEGDGGRLTYAELNGRANRLAHHLRALGVGPESVVGISVERGLEMTVGVLGVLKAGAAYLPLDPSYPRERLAYMLEDARVGVLLTQRGLRDHLPAHGARVICLDADWEAVAAAPAENPRAGATAQNPAYVIYTSGSTGRPKGVLMTHGVLVNLVTWQRQDLEDWESARTLQFASLSFDMSFQEMFAAWSSGGCLVLIDEVTRRDGPALLEFLRRHRVTRLLAPFVALQQLAEAAEESGRLPEQLREVISAGEPLRITPALERLFEKLEGCKLYNQCGPSETHAVTSVRLGGRPATWSRLPPIGRPIWNTRVYVLDRHLSPLPAGVTGEVYIGGDCVSRGFLNRPGLTAERYLPDPYSPDGGARMYRSGDLGRHTNDGQIELVGRADQQVKVRGYRVELGEVETVLDAHGGVGQSVVVVREDAPGQKRLVGYVVPPPGRTAPTAGELRRYARERLPEYMVPVAFVSLPELPLTPSGKINRRALPAPDAARPDLETVHVAPRTPAEKLLADIWAEVLGLEAVGVNDNFLELGGDSILSIQVISRAKQAGLHLTLTHLWEYQTVAGLAAAAADSRPPGAVPGGEAPAPLTPTKLGRGKFVPPAGDGRVEDIYPLTPMQQGILFHSLYRRASGEYVEQFSCDLRGPLDVPAFRRAWERVISRHPALRTAFVWEDIDEPLQVVHDEAALPFELHDWGALSAAEQRERFDAFIEAERAEGTFDLSRAPLVRVFLFRLAEERHRLVWSLHDIVIDGWSAPLILDEVEENYRALSRGLEPRPRPGYSFRSYVDWLGRRRADGEESFWRQTLAGLTAPTPLPYDRAYADDHAGLYAQCRALLSREATAALQAQARRRQLTVNTLAQGAWALVLSRFSGEAEVMFGSVVSGRPAELEGVEEIVGVFVNTLPVRVRVSAELHAEAWLKRIQSGQVEARRYEYSPLSQIQKWSEIPAGRRLFESILAFVNYPEGRQGFWADKDWHQQKSGYPLFVVVRPGEEMLLEITYSAQHFDDGTARRLIDYFQTALAALGEDAARSVASLPTLPPGERRRLLAEWNDTRADFPLHECFQQHFERQAAATPDRVAVAHEGRSLTYAELNRRANRLARALARRGVGPDTVVALLAGRGVELLTAILGVFKAGGAYLPLDPEHPPQRWRQVLRQSGATLALASGALAPVLEEAVGESGPAGRCEVLRVEELIHAEDDGSDLAPRAAPENLAYVIYTSGSTGTPKGVMVEHRGMLNHLYAKINDLGLGEHDLVAQTASQCFDISVWQFLAALLAGGGVRVYGDDVAHHPARLLDRIDSDRVTVVETVPSLMRFVLDEVGRRGAARPGLSALRWMIPTGEALPPELCRGWLGHYPAIPLLNAYGPTECSDDVSHHPVRHPPAEDDVTVPIGRPVANLRLYVLDAAGIPVPVKVTGELCVGGTGVGRGYLHDPRRTAEVFVPDPFSGEAGARLYRTGDLARFLPDGRIEFLGRRDQQVKVRGFRIELGEVEAAVRRHADVRSCVVTAREEEGGDKRLVAYVVAEPGRGVTPEALRAHAGQELPSYMLPSAFVMLERLPLTPNGKIDRNALPAPGRAAARADSHVEPATPTEQAIAAIWGEVLKTEKVGARDDFFARGGHSLLALQVLARMHSAFGVEVEPRALFDRPTVADLAAEVERLLLEEIESISEDSAAQLIGAEGGLAGG